MRLEYVVIGFILLVIVLIVAIAMLKDLAPSLFSILKTFTGR